MAKTKQRRPPTRNKSFSVVHQNAAGIDFGSRFHVTAVASVGTVECGKTFNSFTDDLHQLADWLNAADVTRTAME